MQINITIDGTSTPAQVSAIVRALQAFQGTEIVNHITNLRVSKEVAAAVQADPDGAIKALADAASNAADDSYRTAMQESRSTHTVAAAKDVNIAFDPKPADAPQSAVPLPPTAASAPSTADASASPTAQEASEVFSPSTGIDASLPAPTNPVPAAVAAGLVTDAKGLPWDARIHAGSKTKNADGSWRQRRNLNDPAMVTRVEAELRAALAAGSLVTPNVDGEFAHSASMSTTEVPSPPASSQNSGATSFAGFMKWYVPLVSSGAIRAEDGDAVIKEMGLQSITQLAIRPDMIGQVKAAVSKLLPTADA